MSDVVSLTIGGRNFSGWESLSIAMSIDNVAYSYTLTGAFDPTSSQHKQLFAPFGYKPVKILIDNTLILTGCLESVACALGDTQLVTLQGRSATGVLVDCQIEGPYEFNGLTYPQICDKVSSALGVSVYTTGVWSRIAEVKVDVGQTAYEMLNRIAQDLGWILTTNPQGQLVITKITESSPIAALVEGVSNIISCDAAYNGAERWSKYIVTMQQDGTPGITGVAIDSGVPVARPKLDTGGETDMGGAVKAAEWRRALGLAKSVKITLTVSGWRTPRGELWMPGKTITLKAPSIFIMRETPLIISDVTLNLDASQGRTATLNLVLTSTYTGNMPTRYPWV